MPLLSVLFLLFTSGCVTMFHGTSQEIQFSSDPPGAKVQFREMTCVTPCTLDAPRSSRPAMLRVHLDGREEYAGEIASHALMVKDSPEMLAPAIIGALLIVPGLVDLSSNTLFDWPLAIHAILPPEKQGSVKLEVKRRAD